MLYMNNLKTSFPGQEQDEVVFVFARPYFVAFLPTLLIYLLIFTVTVLAQFGLRGSASDLAPSFINGVVLALGVFQLISLFVFFVLVYDFYLDIIIVTDRRLVNIEHEQVFYHKIAELSLEDVEDVTSEVKGFLPTMFNYGKVTIQTAGEKPNFDMEDVKNPREIAAIVLDLAEQAKRGTPEESRYPEYEVLAVIDNQTIKDPQKLSKIGAALPADLRRFHLNKTNSEKTRNAFE